VINSNIGPILHRLTTTHPSQTTTNRRTTTVPKTSYSRAVARKKVAYSTRNSDVFP